MDTSWLRPFLLLVLIMNSLARCVAGCGSKGLITILLSKGSPGTIWKTQHTWNWHRSSSNQFLKWIIGMLFDQNKCDNLLFWRNLRKTFLKTLLELKNNYKSRTCQWWKTDKQKACPCVWVLKSVSKPKLSMAGMKALMVYSGEPGTGASWVTWPLKGRMKRTLPHGNYW